MHANPLTLLILQLIQQAQRIATLRLIQACHTTYT